MATRGRPKEVATDEVQETAIAKEPKEAKALKKYRAFEYNGKRLEDMDSVKGMKHLEQLEAIQDRCRAMFDYCCERDLIMTNAHIALVLGISKKTLGRWREGKYGEEYYGRASSEEAEFARCRADLISKWQDMAEMRSCDKVSSDRYPAGSIYLTKANFQLWDKPVAEDTSPGVHIENLILRAESLLKNKKSE